MDDEYTHDGDEDEKMNLFAGNMGRQALMGLSALGIIVLK